MQSPKIRQLFKFDTMKTEFIILLCFRMGFIINMFFQKTKFV